MPITPQPMVVGSAQPKVVGSVVLPTPKNQGQALHVQALKASLAQMTQRAKQAEEVTQALLSEKVDVPTLMRTVAKHIDERNLMLSVHQSAVLQDLALGLGQALQDLVAGGSTLQFQSRVTDAYKHVVSVTEAFAAAKTNKAKVARG